MKRIYNQLVKLFPNKMIEISKIYKKYSFNNDINSIYSIYIGDIINRNGNFGISKDCNNLKELDNFLFTNIKHYKKVYKR